jgi:hypothetical protein
MATPADFHCIDDADRCRSDPGRGHGAAATELVGPTIFKLPAATAALQIATTVLMLVLR